MAHRFFEDQVQAKCYKSSRPVPSQQIIHKIIDYLGKNLKSTDDKQWDVAVDVGAGSGQCTEMLQSYFKTLYAFDISEAQVNQARLNNQFDNIHYKVSRSENLPLEDESVDLITASQCFHWFDFEAFFKEANRILKENGVLAVTGYPIPTIYTDEQSTAKASLNSNILFDVYSTTLKPYFEMNRLQYLDNYYKDIEFPFKDVVRANVTAKKEVTAKDCIDYVKSWSGFESCFQKDPKTAEKVINDVESTFMSIFREADLSKIHLIMQTDNILILSRK